VIERVAKVLHRYNMLRRGSRVGVAVSGGADSVCLLHVLEDLAPEFDWALTVLHVNHGLRGEESAADERFVTELAARLSLPVIVCSARIPAGENIEQAARDLRLSFFRRAMEETPLDAVATGHTADDQAETVLFRFLRGSGGAGLSGIRPVTAEGLIRPLIGCDHAATEGYLRERGIEWREDSSNQSREFARNRIRRDLLPMLERDWNPALRQMLVRTADWARAEEEYWSAEIARLEGEFFRDDAGAVLVQVGDLRALPVAVARRLVRRAMERVKGDLRGVEFVHVEAVMGLMESVEGHGRVQAAGLDILRSFDWVRFFSLGEYSLEGRNYEAPAVVPGVTLIPSARVSLVMELLEKKESISDLRNVYNSGSWLDSDRLSGDLRLRNWRPGDQYRREGALQAEKIKSLFQSARVPIWERRHWPVLTDGANIVWSRRFGAAADFAADAGSKRILLVRESK
jgi:tRNA(Ile)-lysidine synthase